MTDDEDPDRLADDLDREADRMEDQSEQLRDEIADVEADWERKRADDSVPGAPPRIEDVERHGPGDSINPEDAAR